MPESTGRRRPPAGGRVARIRSAEICLVFLGGMAGTLARSGLAGIVPTPAALPLGILLINLTGAFALGVLLEALARSGPDGGRRRALRLLAGTGFLGGFTTYSALAVDSALLVGAGRGPEALAYLGGSVLLGLAATAAGIRAGVRFRPSGSGPGTSTGGTP